MAEEDDGVRNSVLSRLLNSLRAISKLPESRNAFRKACGDSVRRVKLLSPLFEESRDRDGGVATMELPIAENTSDDFYKLNNT